MKGFSTRLMRLPVPVGAMNCPSQGTLQPDDDVDRADPEGNAEKFVNWVMAFITKGHDNECCRRYCLSPQLLQHDAFFMARETCLPSE